jgi:hypothetical protein
MICLLYGFRGGFSRPIPSHSHSFSQQSTANNPARPPADSSGCSRIRMVYYTPFRFHSAPMHLVS